MDVVVILKVNRAIQKRTKYLANSFVCLVVAGVMWANLANSSQLRLFRYKNDNGATVVSHQLPPDVVENGYEIITLEGAVLVSVPPAPPVEERKEILRQKALAEERAKADKQLLLRYGNLAELRKATKRILRETKGKITVLQGNLSNLNGQSEVLELKAAGYERAGKIIPAYVLDKLENLYIKQESTTDLIKAQQSNLAKEIERLDADMVRYKELKGM